MGFIKRVQDIGVIGIERVCAIGRSGVMLFSTLVGPSQFSGQFGLIIKQIYQVGVKSLVIIIVSGLFIGMVLGLQGYNILTRYGSEQAVGQMVALTLAREMGPVVTALLFAGRAGSALTAEIGLMKATEQLAGMEMIGVDPLKRIVYPRFWAGIISMPLLNIFFTLVGIYGGALVGVKWLGIYSGAFWGNMQESVLFGEDIMNGMIKSVVFGIVVTWIALYQGLYTQPNSSGISRATTRSVVYASLAVLGLDFVLTAVMFGGL